MAGKKRTTKKKRGRPATGQDPVTAIRLSRRILSNLDLMRSCYRDGPITRSDLIRELVTKGLSTFFKRQQNWAQGIVYERDKRGKEITFAGAFDAEKERLVTDIIKGRGLFEGACDAIPWAEYFKFRDEHDGCELLSDIDRAYAAAYSSCPVPRKESNQTQAGKR